MAASILAFPLVGANDNSSDTPPSSPSALAHPRRKQIEDQIESLIAVLDALDGDCDLEDDDPSGQYDEDELNTVLGAATSSSSSKDWVLLMPRYGVNQARGPLNVDATYRAWQRRQGRAA